MLEVLKAAFYGIVQGLTEFLPVSSSGHLAIMKNIFGLDFDDAVLFTLVLHLGSLIAVFIFYHRDIRDLAANFIIIVIKICTGRFRYSKISVGEKFAVMIFIATVPLVIGAFIDSQIARLRGMGYPDAYINTGNGWCRARVLAGTEQQARALFPILREKGFKDAFPVKEV